MIKYIIFTFLFSLMSASEIVSVFENGIDYNLTSAPEIVSVFENDINYSLDFNHCDVFGGRQTVDVDNKLEPFTSQKFIFEYLFHCKL